MAPGGYAWWYLDALSDDGRFALVAIAFIGSVFSPYYAWRRARLGPAAVPAEQHVAINLALYQPGRLGAHGAWTMTERGAGALQRSPRHLRIGPSTWQREGDALHLTLDERGLPWPLPSRVRGSIRLVPQAPVVGSALPLDADGRHGWWPIAPLARISVDLPEPGWRWQGQAYLDSNRGSVPLAQDFAGWHWQRAALVPPASGGQARQRAAVVYDLQLRGGSAAQACAPGAGRRRLALVFDRHGGCEAFAPPPVQALPASGWRLPRLAASDVAPQLLHTLQDAPFYARSLVQSQWLGQSLRTVHESLDLDRFGRRSVQAMLLARMPRRG